MSDDADTIIKHHGELLNRRSNWDTWWQQIMELVLPAEAQITSTDSEGTKRTERQFDSSAAKANRRFAAIIEDLATPKTQRWHGLEAEDDSLNEDQETDEYFAAVTDVLFKQRYNPRTRFADCRGRNYLMCGGVGNYTTFIDEAFDPISGKSWPSYIACHMREIVWAQDQAGGVDTVYRKYPISGRNALKRFDKQLSPKTRAAMAENPFKDFDFILCTKPNEERVAGRRDYRGMPHSAFYVSCDDKAVVEPGGFTSFPWAIFRNHVAVGETYGRSPAMEAWPAIKTLQEQKKTILRAGQKEVDPPLLLTEEGVLGPFNMRSSALNHGAVSDQGQPLVHPLKLGANIPLGVELMQLEKADVDDSFLASLWNMIVNENVETAAQVFELARMRAINLAPFMGRIDSEDLSPMIHRELDIAAKNGRLPPMPRRLARMGGGYRPVNTSPLARLMRAQDGLAIVRTIEVAEGFMKIDPRAANVVKAPEMFRELAEIQGVQPKLLRSLEEIEQIGQQQAAEEQAASAAAVAPDLSQAALNAAKAQELRGGSPSVALV